MEHTTGLTRYIIRKQRILTNTSTSHAIATMATFLVLAGSLVDITMHTGSTLHPLKGLHGACHSNANSQSTTLAHICLLEILIWGHQMAQRHTQELAQYLQHSGSKFLLHSHPVWTHTRLFTWHARHVCALRTIVVTCMISYDFIWLRKMFVCVCMHLYDVRMISYDCVWLCMISLCAGVYSRDLASTMAQLESGRWPLHAMLRYSSIFVVYE